MREIKFRARWKDTGKVIEDFMDEYTLFHLNDDAIMVEQFTGLLDKNGKEIWEGDIVARYTGGIDGDTFISNWLVEWEDSNGDIGSGFWFGDIDYLVVIGNRFENPELIPN